MKENTNQIAEKVTEVLLTKLEEGVNPWRKPWVGNDTKGSKDLATRLAINYYTNVIYSGINQFLLDAGYYVTFKQCKDLGGRIKKGAKGHYVVYTSEKVIKERREEILAILNSDFANDDTATVGRQVFFKRNGEWFAKIKLLKYYYVYNIEDCEGLKEIKRKEDRQLVALTEDEKTVKAEEIIKDYCERTNLKFSNLKQDRAYYSPFYDEVVVPLKEQFGGNSGEYYSTVFHELGHSTGAKHRLNRDTLVNNNFFGSETYSKEELVAEITSAISTTTLDLATDSSINNSASYLKSWAEAIKSNKDLKENIWNASIQANNAFKMIFNIQ